MDDEHLDIPALERRMTAVRAVHGVTSTIWALSRAQLPRVERALADAATYLEWVDDVVDRIAGPPGRSTAGSSFHVILGPERPFCGGLPRQLLEQFPRTGAIGIVGQRLMEAAQHDVSLTARLAFALPGPNNHDEAEQIAENVATALLPYLAHERVELWYPRRQSGALQSALLIGARDVPRDVSVESYSPLSDVLAAAMHDALAGRIVIGLTEALWVEVRARMLGADQARTASERRLDELRLSWRVRRQHEITNELLEVVAGHRASSA